jgi:hypothetical protein
LSRPESRVKTPEAFEEMRRHILSLYRGVHVPHSFLLETQAFDCVPITEQPSVRLGRLKIATPPPPIEPPPTQALSEPGPPAGGQPDEPQVGGNKVDVFGNAISCDEGTIPMRRVTLEEMTRFGSLREFFAEPGGAGRLHPAHEPSPAITAADHKHANARQIVNNNGGGSWLNIWDPSLAAQTDFSLSQQWYIGGTYGSAADPEQTVEGGWIKYPYKWGDKSVLFVFYTPDSYTTPCYNLCGAKGFVQTDKTWALGGPFPNYSTVGGAQYEFQMVWRHTGGNWWLYLQRGGGTLNPIGYYPDTFFGTGQLSKNATYIYYGGETAPSASTGPWPPMGSGQFAEKGYQYAAYQSVIHYFDLSGNSQWPTLTPSVDSSPTCYTLTFTPASSGGSWGAYIYFGGPGGNSC